MPAPTPGHVFLVDDNPDIRHNLSHLLRKIGYSVDTFADAAEFIRLAPRLSPAVLVLDVRMPQMTGVQLQAHLVARGWHTPVVFISGESEHHEIIQAMKAANIDMKNVVVGGVDSDRLYPLRLQEEIADGISTCSGLEILKSKDGHDGFLTEADAVAGLLRRTMEFARTAR